MDKDNKFTSKIVNSRDKIRKFSKFNSLKGIKHIRTVEQLITPQQQVEKLKNSELDIVKGDRLYEFNMFENKTKLYQHFDEIHVCCPNDKTTRILKLIESSSYSQLVESKFQHVHLGFLLIGVQGMHREGLGNKTMLTLIDTRHIGNIAQAIVSRAEIDMSVSNAEIVYVVPNFMCDIEALYKHIRIVVQTKGYDMVETNPNLMITKLFIGRLANQGNLKYTLKINDILEILGSQNIVALPEQKFDSKKLENCEWIIKALDDQGRNPRDVSYYSHNNGSCSIRFSDYKGKAKVEIDSDDE